MNIKERLQSVLKAEAEAIDDTPALEKDADGKPVTLASAMDELQKCAALLENLVEGMTLARTTLGFAR